MLKQFFILCSGADKSILKKCSEAEQTKYVGIGGTVFFTAVMAFIAASFALYTVFNSLFISLLFGIIWGLLIFNLDRYIVSTLRKSDSKNKELLQALPRIVLAIIIAIVISKPLELKIFEKEINQVLLEEKNTFTKNNKEQIASIFEDEKNKINTTINSLKQEISIKESETNQLYDTYIAEAEGRKGTKLIGKGPVYKEKREKHDTSLSELTELKKINATKIIELEKQLEELNKSQKETEMTSQPIIDNIDGLMARINALNKLPLLPSFFIFLLFLAIETAPILSKLIATKGEYDYLLENHEEGVKNWVNLQKVQTNFMNMSASTLDEQIYNELTQDEELYQFKKKKAKEILEMQASQFYKNQQQIIG